MISSCSLISLLLYNLACSWLLPPALVSSREVEQLEARFLEDLDAYRSRTCPRPVLHPPALSGQAGDALRVITEGGDDLRECYQLLEDFGEVLFGPPAPGGERHTGLIRRFSTTCGVLPQVIRRATSFERGCSPYSPGGPGLPDLRILSRAVAASRQLAALKVLSGHPGEAAEAFLDLLRFSQDLIRGGAPMALVVFSTTITRDVLTSDINQLLERHDLTKAELMVFLKGIGALFATEPSFPEAVSADATWLAWEAGIPLLRGPNWEPPGGFSFGHAMTPQDHRPDLLPWTTSSQERRLIFVALMERREELREACPVTSTLTACREGLATRRAQREAARRMPRWQRLFRIAVAPRPWRRWRQLQVEELQGLMEIPYTSWAADFGLRREAYQAVIEQARTISTETL